MFLRINYIIYLSPSTHFISFECIKMSFSKNKFGVIWLWKAFVFSKNLMVLCNEPNFRVPFLKQSWPISPPADHNESWLSLSIPISIILKQWHTFWCHFLFDWQRYHLIWHLRGLGWDGSGGTAIRCLTSRAECFHVWMTEHVMNLILGVNSIAGFQM